MAIHRTGVSTILQGFIFDACLDNCLRLYFTVWLNCLHSGTTLTIRLRFFEIDESLIKVARNVICQSVVVEPFTTVTFVQDASALSYKSKYKKFSAPDIYYLFIYLLL